MKNQITITRADNGFVLSVDGGSIECGTTAEVMSRVGHEMGMPFNKAQRQLFERMEAAEKLADDLVSENNALLRANTDLCYENDMLRKAIVRCFRAKTFIGIARAMAELWTSYIENGEQEEEQISLFEKEDT